MCVGDAGDGREYEQGPVVGDRFHSASWIEIWDPGQTKWDTLVTK